MNKSTNSNSDTLHELKLISIDAARKILHIRHETLKKLILDGVIAATLVNSRYKIPVQSLRKYIDNIAADPPRKDLLTADDAVHALNQLINKYSPENKT